VWLSSFAFYQDVLPVGVKLFRYRDGFLHQKVMLVDDAVAVVGTANLDNRSFRLNFEVTAVVHDSAFAADVERMFEEDFSRSRKMEPGEYDEKSFLFRLGVKLARLSAPLQ